MSIYFRITVYYLVNTKISDNRTTIELLIIHFK